MNHFRDELTFIHTLQICLKPKLACIPGIHSRCYVFLTFGCLQSVHILSCRVIACCCQRISCSICIAFRCCRRCAWSKLRVYLLVWNIAPPHSILCIRATNMSSQCSHVAMSPAFVLTLLNVFCSGNLFFEYQKRTTML